ncbi:MAG: M28 family metallopeptidase [Candidatus Rifleibacteriota bacterium]
MKFSGRYFIFAVLISIVCSASLLAGNWVYLANADTVFSIVKNSDHSVESYTRLGDYFILTGEDVFAENLQKSPGVESFPMRDGENLYLITSKDPAILSAVFPGVRTVWEDYGLRVVIAGEVAGNNLMSKSSAFTKVELLEKNTTILSEEIICKATAKNVPDNMSAFIKLLDIQAFMQDLQTMVDFKTRYSYVEGAQKAIDYCAAEFTKLGIKSEQQVFNIGSSRVNNLVATVKGSNEKDFGQVLVVGHLDSTSPNPRNDAPGADDNGSGSAGVLAIARMLKASGLQTAATVKFILFLGEEQGLYGSKAYVRNLNATDKKNIVAVLNLDMIGFDKQPPLSVLLETNSFNRPMIENMQDLAQKHTELSIRTSFSAWGSDHAPFLQQRIPAVLTIESEFSSNPNYHQTTDLIPTINQELCQEILKLNAATMYKYSFSEK